MNVAFKQDQVYRGDYTFRNSPAAIRRFPLPFPEDRYMYSVNIEPHTGGPAGSVVEFPIDCDEHYVEECRERAIVIEHDPLRIQALPHMMSAQWDTLELGMQSLSQSYPDKFTLTRNGREWHHLIELCGMADAVVVVGEPFGSEVAAHARQLDLRVRVNPAPERGMASSVALGPSSCMRCHSSRTSWIDSPAVAFLVASEPPRMATWSKD